MTLNNSIYLLDTIEKQNDLGVIIDTKLSFDDHINQAVNKAKKVLNEKKRVYFQADLAEQREVQRTVRSEIRKARESYKNKIELKFKTGDMRTVWETMSDMQQNRQISYRLSPLGGRDDRVFAKEMNSFYTLVSTHTIFVLSLTILGDQQRQMVN